METERPSKQIHSTRKRKVYKTNTNTVNLFCLLVDLIDLKKSKKKKNYVQNSYVSGYTEEKSQRTLATEYLLWPPKETKHLTSNPLPDMTLQNSLYLN